MQTLPRLSANASQRAAELTAVAAAQAAIARMVGASPMDIQTFLRDLHAQHAFPRIALNELSQFGQPGQPYLGATLLPERRVPRNEYTETGVRYRTTVANDGSRYSPAQRKGKGVLVGSVPVVLGDSDIKTDFTAHDLDAVLEMILPIATLQTPAGMQAAAAVLGWGQAALNNALIERNEIQRFQALVDGKVIRRGDNDFYEEVVYPNPDGHRVAAGGDWTDPEYNILGDLLAMKRKLATKGGTVTRMLGSTAVLGLMLANQSLAKAAGKAIITVAPGGTLTQTAAAFSEDDLTALLRANGLPAFEVYDRTYFLDDGTTGRFMPEDAVILACTTGRDERVALANDPNTFRLVQNTLGYTAVGRAVGQLTPGRVIQVTYFSNKPPRLEGEAWQSSLPVILDPESFGVITDITLPG